MSKRMRPGTRRLIKWFASGLAAMVLLVVLVVWGLPDPSAADHLEAAQAFEAAGSFAEAEDSLKRALEIDAAHVEARWTLASLYLRLGHGYAARLGFEQALTQGYRGADAETNLFRARMLTGEHPVVVDELSKRAGREKSLPLSVLLAEALIGTQEFGEAEQVLDAARRRFGADPELARVNALLAIAQNQFERASEIVNASPELLEPTPGNLRMRGDLALGRRDAQGAFKAFQDAVKADPYHLDGQFGLVRAQILSNRVIEAEATLLQIFENRPRDPRVDYLQAVAAYRRADVSTAKSKLHQVLGMAPQHLASITLLSNIHIGAKEFDAAEALLERAIAAAPGQPSSLMLLADVHIRKSDGVKALRVLSPLLEGSFRSPQLYGLASRAHRVEDELEQAFSYQVRAHLLAGDLARAREAADDFAREQPDSAAPLIFMGVIHERERNELSARAVYEEALLMDGSNPAGALNLARLDASGGDLEAARARYEGVLAKNPGELTALMGLATVEARTGGRDKAVELLERARKAHAKSLEPRLRLLSHYLASAQPKVALSIAREAAAIAPKNPAAILGLARAQGAAGASGAALRTLGNVLKQFPKFSAAHAEQGRVLESLGRNEEARASFRRAIDTDTSRLASQIALTRLEIRTGAFDQAASIIAKLKEAQADESLPFELAGELELARGRLDDALAEYEQAYERAPSGQLLVKRVGVHRARGETDLAAQLMGDWLRRNPEDTLMQFAIAQTAQLDGDVRKAETAYREILGRAPDFVPALNNLGMLLLKRAPDEGANLISKAYELAPTDAVVRDSYGWLLVQQGKLEDAISLLRTVVRQAPGLPDAKYHLAVALARSNLKVSARRLLEELLKRKESFSDRNAAADLLAELKTG
ncbi:MAG: XrtA/PEP-CTERM system TPR-repeat protein PrsT [Pseudomonadota bacterium]